MFAVGKAESLGVEVQIPAGMRTDFDLAERLTEGEELVSIWGKQQVWALEGTVEQESTWTQPQPVVEELEVEHLRKGPSALVAVAEVEGKIPVAAAVLGAAVEQIWPD